jgi:hypothetical protein
MKHMIWWLIGLILLTACGPSKPAVQTTISQTYAAQATPTPQPTPVPQPCLTEEVRTSVEDIRGRFIDQVRIASSTQRVSLSPVIANLNVIREEANLLRLPDCAAELKPYLLAFMDVIITRYTEYFDLGTPNADYFISAAEYMSQYTQAFDAIKLADSILASSSVQAVGSSAFMISEPRVVQTTISFELRHTLDVPVHYIRGDLRYNIADGSSVVIDTFYCSMLDPGEMRPLGYERPLTGDESSLDLYSVYVTIQSAYMINP